MKQFFVIKANGEREIFDPRKLENSLRKIGTNDDLIREILFEVEKRAFDGITTSEIYKKAFSILKKKHKPIAVRYSLKKAVAMLGPTGFPFEKFVAEIFRAEGYEIETDQIVEGKCVSHEVDVVAWKEKELIMTEAKFHTDFNLKSDLKIVLYVKARYDDLSGKNYVYGGIERQLTEGWLVTNTKFSATAIQYAECQKNLKLYGWNYPYKYNLHDMIEKHQLIPITALTTLNMMEKEMFLTEGIVLSKNLLDTELFKKFGFEERKMRFVQEEVKGLCEHCK